MKTRFHAKGNKTPAPHHCFGKLLFACSSVSECELEDICVLLLRLALPKQGQGENLSALIGTSVRNV